MNDLGKRDPLTPRMGVYTARVQYDVIIDKLKLRIVVIGYLQNKDIIGNTWAPTASMINLEYFLLDATNRKARVHQ